MILLPSSIVELPELEEGDDIEAIVADDRTFAVRKKTSNKELLNLFRVGRHLVRAAHHRIFLDQAFCVWREATCLE